MYCTNCGEKIDKNASICPYCGVAQKLVIYDNGGFGWGLLGCCIPLVGLILFLVWKDQKPKTAKAAGKGALVAVVCIGLFYAAIIALGIFGATLDSGY